MVIEMKVDRIYMDGKLDGLYTEWYDNGVSRPRTKRFETTYKNGKEDGLWTQWYRNGQKESESTFKDGKLNGMVTDWNPNGQKSSEVTWKDGRRFPRGIHMVMRNQQHASSETIG
jgi:antitoxin component YwqK of YwqJK toxin-antitoxin module